MNDNKIIKFLEKSFFKKKTYPSGKWEYELLDFVGHNYSNGLFSRIQIVGQERDLKKEEEEQKEKAKKSKEYILDTFKKVFVLDQEEKFKKSNLSKYLDMKNDIFVSYSSNSPINTFRFWILSDLFCLKEYEEFNEVNINEWWGSGLGYINPEMKKRFFGWATKIVTFEERYGELSLKDELDVSSWEPNRWSVNNSKLGKIEDYSKQIGKILDLKTKLK